MFDCQRALKRNESCVLKGHGNGWKEQASRIKQWLQWLPHWCIMCIYWGFLKWGYPKWLGYKGKSHYSKLDDLGYPYFRRPPYRYAAHRALASMISILKHSAQLARNHVLELATKHISMNDNLSFPVFPGHIQNPPDLCLTTRFDNFYPVHLILTAVFSGLTFWAVRQDLSCKRSRIVQQLRWKNGRFQP